MTSKSSNGTAQHGHLSSKLLDMKFMKRNTNNNQNSDDEVAASEQPSGIPTEDPSAWTFTKVIQKPREEPIGFSDIEKPKLFGRRSWKNGKCAEVRTEATEKPEVDKEVATPEKKPSKPSGRKRKKDEDRSTGRPRKQKK